jgi:protein-L-isoaspartate(D-aspartate) O-methyltransferase
MDTAPFHDAHDPPEAADARMLMVAEHLERRGIRDPRVLDAMRRVPRHLFLPGEVSAHAYEDRPLAIGGGQTISQPYMVARMTEWLMPKADDKVLEVGTGSGYQAAVLALLAREVWTIERIPEHARAARERLAGLGISNVTVVEGDGTLGWADEAPYDGIIVTAGAPRVPGPLQRQLAEAGRLVCPVGDAHTQQLVRVSRHAGGWQTDHDTPCVFVPLLGAEGWPQS